MLFCLIPRHMPATKQNKMMQAAESEVASPKPYRFAFVLLPKFSSLTLSALVGPLRIANYCDGRRLYAWSYVSVEGGDVPGCSGYSVGTEAIGVEHDVVDAVIVCGGWNAERYDAPELIRWLRRIARRNAVIGAVEMGSYVLARAGLLVDISATVHWHCHNAFLERYPEIDLRDELFVFDRNRMTAAGGAACLDMMLHEIRTRHGKALATEVAQQVVYPVSRDGSLPQKDTSARGQAAIPQVLVRAVAQRIHADRYVLKILGTFRRGNDNLLERGLLRAGELRHRQSTSEQSRSNELPAPTVNLAVDRMAEWADLWRRTALASNWT